MKLMPPADYRPPGWTPDGPYVVRREGKVAVYQSPLDGQFTASYDEVWVDGLYPTFHAAIAAAWTALENMTALA